MEGADPGFLLARQSYILLKFLPKSLMKWKKFWYVGAGHGDPSLYKNVFHRSQKSMVSSTKLRELFRPPPPPLRLTCLSSFRMSVMLYTDRLPRFPFAASFTRFELLLFLWGLHMWIPSVHLHDENNAHIYEDVEPIFFIRFKVC